MDNERRVGYLTETVPVTEDLLTSLGQTSAPEVLRVAAPCMHGACAHFEEGACALAGRVARMLGPVVGTLPRCAIRPSCRWFREQGPAACVRCPQVVTNSREGSGVPAEVAYHDGIAPSMHPGVSRAVTNLPDLCRRAQRVARTQRIVMT